MLNHSCQLRCRPPTPPILQVLDGSRPAKTCGTYEFIHVMDRLATDIQARLDADPSLEQFFKENGGVKFMFDHVRYHDKAEAMLRARGMEFRVPSPPWSPDFNRPVERAHGTVKRMFKADPQVLGGANMMEQFKARIVQLVRDHVTHRSAAEDIATLDVHWQVVASNTNQLITHPNGKVYRGSDGNWPHKDLR